MLKLRENKTTRARPKKKFINRGLLMAREAAKEKLKFFKEVSEQMKEENAKKTQKKNG